MIRLVALRLTHLVISKLPSRIVPLGGAGSAKASRCSYSATNLRASPHTPQPPLSRPDRALIVALSSTAAASPSRSRSPY
jgi:hypothetical protein